MGTVRTSVITKLSAFAEALARHDDAPRAVFLIGGPGNGKSEAVEAFGRALDDALGMEGALVHALAKAFEPDPLVPRVVRIRSTELGGSEGAFAKAIGCLSIVHDASATTEPDGDAGRALIEELAALAREEERHVFLSCINRGVLTRAFTLAQDSPHLRGVGEILKALIDATKQVPSERAPDVPCWPLQVNGSGGDELFACWPMDAQSLLLEPEYGGLDPSPIDQILRAATEVDAWETVGACANCDSRTICPFRQNAAWLRDEGLRQHLLRALRMAELGTRQRWNFRNVFSLTAEILVGDWGDFGDARHPCDWVHARTALVRERDEVTDAVRPLRELVSRLYPHALAPVGRVGPMPTEPVETAEERGYRVTLAIEQEEGRLTTQAHSYIRRFLQDEFSERLDPATYSSGTRADAIRAIEDAYSVSIRLANRSWPGSHAPAGAERMYLRLLAVAESEWDILDTESARAVAAVAYLRAAATCLAKRSLGTRSGRFAGTGHLEKYMRILRNPDEWWALNDDVLDLLGGEKMHFDATGTFGQPRPSEEPLVSLHVDFRPRPIMPAPQPTPERPAHDLPFLEIAGVYMPLTFDLYEALMYRQEGAPGGSLPASVQTAIDLVRHVHAGKKSRAPSFIDERARYVVGDFGQIEAGPSGHPVFRARR